MNNPLAYELAKTRIADLQRSAHPQVAADRPTRRTSRVVQPRPARERAGWWLVTVGLRLAGSADGLR